MNKLTKKLTIPFSEKQIDLVERACAATALRRVDIVRVGIFEMLKDADAARYHYSQNWRLAYGEAETRIQVPLSRLMFNRLVRLADEKGIRVVDLARLAACDFARRNQS